MTAITDTVFVFMGIRSALNALNKCLSWFGAYMAKWGGVWTLFLVVLDIYVEAINANVTCPCKLLNSLCRYSRFMNEKLQGLYRSAEFELFMILGLLKPMPNP